ncbi:helix-turn-helix transcriptional regulator [Hymenobacter chitinivorans]|uniref:DNA-binding NarL/FixJ family response regulator n=1 Tax=Hymenobacter chitinivorans DSM 11115 TaxID=1121954 RepID=A0A2M9ASC7_9BACT|nr:LuxR C-terminal-related transcriptional regulator [Hymenobacter chitinivorans]PJJ48543.1 DNA-binding NarL/FixJ family response regulator [Hymenobacter chitinivorans DSM 11115]
MSSSSGSGPILIVGPPTLYRQGLLLTLQQAWPTLEFVLTADACQAPTLLRQAAYGLVVVDGLLPDPPLPQLVAQLAQARAHQHLLLLTGPRQAPELRHLPARPRELTLVPRHAAPEVVVAAARILLAPSRAFSRPLPAASVRPAARLLPPPTPFSRRELEVLRLVVADYCNQDIANELCLSVRTVESHRRALLHKAGARTLVGLVVCAMRQGWVAA